MLFICETWCDECVLFSIKPFDEYDIYGRNRNKYRGGVILMALKTLRVKQCIFDNFNTKTVW